ncbi:MAG: prolipoprotein diacylglyceryl transferase [Clostridia bacterium]|nr:prolipoprotein diacylglyceryl transferase [Clostridia bacterium]
MHPFIHIFGLEIPSYGLMMALAFILAIVLSYFRAKKAGKNPEIILDLAIAAIVIGLGCAYLLYIFVTYPLDKIWKSITDGSFSVFKSGGLVFYGGVIGGALAVIGYLKLIKKQKVWDYSAIIVPTIPLAHAVGRIGCFLAGCCYGKCVDTPISVIYTNPIGGAPTGTPVFPIQLVESACNIVVFVILLLYVGRQLKRGSVLFLYMILYGIERFVLEYFRYDEIRGIFLGLSTSQWISIAMVVIGAVGLMLSFKREKTMLRAAAAAPSLVNGAPAEADEAADAGDPTEADEAADADSVETEVEGAEETAE